jgi:peptidoglycan/xylan/chitin deacetylase (PgdA/CDA1 family)
MCKMILTFDIEDFINPNELSALELILELLEKYKLKAIFFITAHMAEKLNNFPKILELLQEHEIGYHSSGHSVRPIIAEYTDVQNYDQAYLRSVERETAHLNPLTGKIEKEGGIHVLQRLFKPKKIRAFRAPGMSWTPPHLEALARLGIEFDFSSDISISEPAFYKGITFYPYTFTQVWNGNLSDYKCLLSALYRNKVAILGLHPTWFVNEKMWDSIYYEANPTKIVRVQPKSRQEIELLFAKFELLLKQIKLLQQCRLVKVDINLFQALKKLTVNQNQVQKCYEKSMVWPITYFNYYPVFIRNHFNIFFQNAM